MVRGESLHQEEMFQISGLFSQWCRRWIEGLGLICSNEAVVLACFNEEEVKRQSSWFISPSTFQPLPLRCGSWHKGLDNRYKQWKWALETWALSSGVNSNKLLLLTENCQLRCSGTWSDLWMQPRDAPLRFLRHKWSSLCILPGLQKPWDPPRICCKFNLMKNI